jgi:hypothetical protein
MYGYMTQLIADDHVAELLAQAARQRRRSQAGRAAAAADRACRKPATRPAQLRLDAGSARRAQPLGGASGSRVTTVRVRPAADC